MRSELSKLQGEFAGCLAEWILYVKANPGWDLTLAEGYVGDTDAADGDYDGPHLRSGGHYKRIAQDVNLFINDVLISDSQHPVWHIIGRKWETMHPKARWGGRFARADANHVSFEHDGVA